MALTSIITIDPPLKIGPNLVLNRRGWIEKGDRI